jgi:hypothetical protein
MKLLLIATLVVPLGIQAGSYSKNDGQSVPETFSAKDKNEKTIKKSYFKTTTIERHEQAPTAAGKTELNKGGVSAQEMNTSPNAAPSDHKELIEGTTLKRDQDLGTVPEEIQAQEEDALDYSTTPEKRPKTLEQE